MPIFPTHRPRRLATCEKCGHAALAGRRCGVHLAATFGPTIYRPSWPRRVAA